VLSAVGVRMHLIEVLLTSSLGLRPFSVKVSTDLDQGLLGDPDLLLPCGEGLLPHEELLL
jgi:hypothetical protein